MGRGDNFDSHPSKVAKRLLRFLPFRRLNTHVLAFRRLHQPFMLEFDPYSQYGTRLCLVVGDGHFVDPGDAPTYERTECRSLEKHPTVLVSRWWAERSVTPEVHDPDGPPATADDRH